VTRPLAAAGAACVGLALAACGTGSSTAESPTATDGTAVVATTTMLGDVAARVATCADGSASTLMPLGADPHDFSPSSEQVAEIVGADLVVANGLGLEESLGDALSSAAADGAAVLEVAPLVDPLEFSADEHGDDDTDLDPHFWHDVGRMAAAAELIGAELASSTGDEAFADCGRAVADELRETDAQVREILSGLDPDRRVMVTDHDAFAYFADAYDFDIAGVVVPGGATLAEPSSRELAALVDVIEAKDVRAIFSNTAASSALSDAVAAEAGTDVEVVELFVGSLGPGGSGAQTYADMVLTNAQRIADALSG
jgi:zinc/manganese transport system substrate-binding protein